MSSSSEVRFFVVLLMILYINSRRVRDVGANAADINLSKVFYSMAR